MHQPTRTHNLLALLVTGLAGAAGCAFVEDAAQMVIGADSGLPAVSTSATVDVEHVNNALRLAVKALQVPGERVEPWLLHEGATWADVRTSLCGMTDAGILPWPSIAVDVERGSGERAWSDVTMRLEVPVARAGDLAECLAAPLAGEMRVVFSPFALSDVSALEEQLGAQVASLKDAVMQVRFLISKFAFVRCPMNGESEEEAASANNVLSYFHLALVEPDIIDDPRTPYADGWLELVPQFLLDTISEASPERFELDPDSPVTAKLLRVLLTPPETWAEHTVTVEARVELADDALLQTPLAGSGMIVHAQPEVVVDGLAFLGL